MHSHRDKHPDACAHVYMHHSNVHMLHVGKEGGCINTYNIHMYTERAEDECVHI